jgi:hypothetical protein
MFAFVPGCGRATAAPDRTTVVGSHRRRLATEFVRVVVAVG